MNAISYSGMMPTYCALNSGGIIFPVHLNSDMLMYLTSLEAFDLFSTNKIFCFYFLQKIWRFNRANQTLMSL